MALKQFDCEVGEGLITDMRAVRKDYFLDHDHSAYVDQWDWERVITAEAAQPRLPRRTSCKKIWKVLKGAESSRSRMFPQLKTTTQYPSLPDELTFLHAEEILDTLSRTCRASSARRGSCRSIPAVFIFGIGWTLEDGYPHEMRAADYDDWVTETTSEDGQPMHGLNGDILVWNPVTKRRHELTSMGIRVNARRR